MGRLAISCTVKRTTRVRLSSLSLAAIATRAIAQATKNRSLKNVLPPRRQTLRLVSRPGRVTKIVTTEIMPAVAVGTEATVVAPIRGTSTVQTAHARTHGSIVTVLVRCSLSARMGSATTTTTTVVAAGMAETVADVPMITIFAQIVAVVTLISKATTLACRNVQFKRGKVMADVTTATISADAIGTVVIVAQKQTRN